MLAVSAAGCGEPLSVKTADESGPPQAAAPADGQPPADVEEDFSRLLLDRPPVPLTQPRDVEPAPEEKADAPAPAVVDRLCRIEPFSKSGWSVLKFLDSPGRPSERPRLILFSRLLEQIEPLAAREPPVILRASGETTVYKQLAFILLTEPPVIVSKAQADEPEAPATAPTEAPTTTEAVGDGSKSVSAERIRELLMKGSDEQPLPVPPRPRPETVIPAPSVAPTPGGPGLPYGPEAIVADRLIRLVAERRHGWMLARFEADNTLQQPPLRLLPCRLLEKAERLAAEAQGRMVRFRVSGRITQYKGRRYLLLSKLIREREMGQF